ncbi:MAG: hypothetical protein ACE5LU_27785 [Anaerolineae bacterium]
MEINWDPPAPRGGLAGAWDRFVGSGATAAEIWLQAAPAIAAGMAVPANAILNDLGWTLFHRATCGGAG